MIRRAQYCLLLITCLVFTSCRESPRVLLVIPDDFRGTFTIRQDAANIVPNRAAGSIVVKVPRSGDAVLPDISLLKRWHRLEAQCESGGDITIHPVIPPTADEPIVRSLYSDSERVYYFVGSADEADRLAP
jgi:hypothetical protein